MGLLDRAKKMAEKAGPLIDKAAPHARTVVDKAGQQVDKRTGGKYHDKIEQVEQKVGEYADKRMAAGGTGPADGFPPSPPPATTPPSVDNVTASAPPATDAQSTPADTASAAGTEASSPAAGPDTQSDRPAP